MKTLSKSDFQLASSCSKKLVYKKAGYPTINDTNEYMQLLAQGGYIVSLMATLYYPQGIEIKGNRQECIDRTRELMQRENVVLFEPAILSGQKFVRIDILEKKGRELHLIEVKAKSHDTDAKEEESKKVLKKYIEDVAYQYMLLSDAYPDYDITCSLFMPDKAKRTQIEGLAGWFIIEKGEQPENDCIITQENPRFQKPKVVFKYKNHPKRNDYLNLLVKEGILEKRNVTNEGKAMQPEISQRAESFLHILNEGISETDYQISKACKSCEFNTPDAKNNGYGECWGLRGYKTNHIFDLYYGGSIGTQTKGYYLDQLILEGRTDLFDIDPDRLKNAKGEIGSRAERQIIQLNNTRNNTEWISPELKSKLDEFQYPLHFIDFETYIGAIPFFKGMRPYELIAFQWSCHTIRSKGDTPEHKEWIHTGEMFHDPNKFPGFEFARSLMNYIKDSGTPFMWATHENSVLRTILGQMDSFGLNDEELSSWLTRITKDKDRDGRLVDMNKMTLKYYFHPLMKGKTSIKKVLPAIWNSFPYLHEVPHFNSYAPKDLIAGYNDPYDTLTAGIGFADMEDDVVSGGTDAMRAYQRILFDNILSLEKKSEIRRQLLEYCKLDTMAMVIIAHHWGLR